ncbi:MAG TPA: AmmeMemoRadiSam system protein A [Patescibacteria group bacterium]|nr:AmmeMemoRadiSam system protein A [Patescibacteria group bacterium]
MYSQAEKKFILQLARRAIEYYLESGSELEIKESEIPFSNLRQRAACFVTLTIQHKLRGCVGSLETVRPLYEDVIKNSLAAAFEDSRFTPLEKEELKNILIEISILSSPKRLEYKDSSELLRLLRPSIDGVIIEKGSEGATYLPQVWDELKKPEEFLSSLCLKAGLPEDEWKNGKLKVSTYIVEVISE